MIKDMTNNIISIKDYKKKQFNKLLKSDPKYCEINRKIHFAFILLGVDLVLLLICSFL